MTSVDATFRPVRPVYSGYFADPFAWRYEGRYYAIGTGESEASGTTSKMIFPLLKSEDFAHWESAGKAMLRPDASLGNTFWAPEVAYDNGTFFLYYSVGYGDKNHQLRVASSAKPLGLYEDLAKPVLNSDACPFAIDPHPFRDDDGQWYLFYARDFVDCAANARVGTALMVARFRTMTELEGPGKVVLRARSDWQRFQANRLMYGRVWDWHTLEGPCVRKHDGKYYCLYSGGRWDTENYGVDFGMADEVMGPYSDEGNAFGPRILRTVPGQLLGPGHNSIVLGPDGETEYIVYHAWDKEKTARRMFVEPLVWTEEGPRVVRASERGASERR